MENPKKGFEHPRFIEAVKHLYPDADIRAAVSLVDYGAAPQSVEIKNGDGPFGLELRTWTLPNLPPSYEQVEVLVSQLDLAVARTLRQAAYVSESDPMALRAQRLEWQGDELAPQAKADYLAKVAEIKVRFPYPEAP